MTALTTPQSPGMGMSTSNNTSLRQPALNTPSAGKKHKISPGVSLISGGIAGGVEAATTGTTFKAGVRFLSFDSIRNALMDEKGSLTPARGILAGMIAGCVESVVAVTPTERVKTAL
ncbi:Tricarboxylate transport protein [Colletotrichum tropicale]|nr:Tricarboxylate transport protein [Colletotrichum tropicale]